MRNKEIIEIIQDSNGIQASRIQKEIQREGTVEAWAAKLNNNKYAILFFNKGETQLTLEVSIKD